MIKLEEMLWKFRMIHGARCMNHDHTDFNNVRDMMAGSSNAAPLRLLCARAKSFLATMRESHSHSGFELGFIRCALFDASVSLAFAIADERRATRRRAARARW